MGGAVAELLVLLKLRNETSGEVDKVKKDLGGLKSMLGDVGKTAGGFVVGTAFIGGAKALVGQLGSVISEAREAREIMAQTEAVIKSTGGAAGFTARQISDLAGEQARLTNFEDDEVQSAANILLTFTKINKDVFPDTLSLAQDLSQAFGTDLQSSAVMLGKALQDPIAGVTALRKVGVTLSEAQEQQIRDFIAINDLASAQKVILGELAVEVGGSAKATHDPLTEMGQQFGDLKEGIGLALLPLLLAFAGVMNEHIVPALMMGVQWFSDFVSLIHAALTGDVGRAAELFAGLPAPLQQVALWLARNKEQIIGIVAGARDFVVEVVQLLLRFAQWTKDSGLLYTALTGLKTIGEGLVAAFALIAPLVEQIVNWLREHETVAKVLGVALVILIAVAISPLGVALLGLILIIGYLRNNWDELKAKTLEVWNAIPEPVRIALEVIWALIQFYIAEIVNFVKTEFAIIRDVVKIVMAVLQGDWGAAWEGMKDLVTDVVGGIRGVIQPLIDLVQDLIDTIGKIPDPGDIPGAGLIGKASGVVGGIVRRAAGGPASGWTVVGEKGWELVNLPNGSRVYSHEDSRAMLAGAGGRPMIVHVHIEKAIYSNDPREMWQSAGVML